MRVIRLLPLFLLFISACTKSSGPSSSEESIVGSKNSNSKTTNLIEDARKYTEFACVVSNCAGTVCEGSKGSCKSKACTAIPDACTKIALTPGEIEIIATKHANKMVAEGYIDAKDSENSKNLVIGILRKK
jgi:hypothetical protein